MFQAERTVQRPRGRKVFGVFLKQQRSEWLLQLTKPQEEKEQTGQIKCILGAIVKT